MIEIADVSQVSRATLYNHFRDKKSVLRALLESEVERVIQFIDSDQSLVDSLSQISHEISSDPALAMMRSTDPAVLAGLLSGTEDLLWVHVRSELFRLIGNKRVAEVARLWLVGQVLQPVSFEESREQARIISQLKS